MDYHQSATPDYNFEFRILTLYCRGRRIHVDYHQSATPDLRFRNPNPDSLVQGQAEFYLERLHSVSEKELDDLTNADAPVTAEEWIRFREKLIGLTDVTRSHFEKLVQVRKITGCASITGCDLQRADFCSCTSQAL